MNIIESLDIINYYYKVHNYICYSFTWIATSVIATMLYVNKNVMQCRPSWHAPRSSIIRFGNYSSALSPHQLWRKRMQGVLWKNQTPHFLYCCPTVELTVTPQQSFRKRVARFFSLGLSSEAANCCIRSTMSWVVIAEWRIWFKIQYGNLYRCHIR